MAKLMRVQKFLAHAGVGSRRAVERLIDQGRVMVNGVVLSEQGVKIDPELDKVAVDGEIIEVPEEFEYWLVYKPVGMVSSTKRQDETPIVTELVKSDKKLFPVGRLDKDSEGLILLTNDGALAHRLTHPKFHIDKTYEVLVQGKVTDKKLDRLRKGVRLAEGMTRPTEVNILRPMRRGIWLNFRLHEGKFRQIRRMCSEVGLEVKRLIRIQFGPLTKEGLQPEELRPLSEAEIGSLYRLADLNRE
jgi:23S rRNA pseudouridine2605 synthase